MIKEGRSRSAIHQGMLPSIAMMDFQETPVFSGADDAKDRIRRAVDIVDLVGEQIALRRQGRLFVGLCPWHDDSRPSLQVNPDRQTWKCWVCDVGGDVFSYVMQREGIDFRQSLEMLAEREGISLESNTSPHRAPAGSAGDKNTLYRAIAWASQRYHHCLMDTAAGEAARAYLRGRGIQDESFRRFQLGYAPHDWQWLIEQAAAAGFSLDVLKAVGLTAQSDRTGRWYDRFRGRVLFPIADPQRRPIALGGRILPEYAEQEPAKYINSPETRLFSKSEQLYGLQLARDEVTRRREVLVMEGYTDVVIAQQFGIENSVAVLGTALGLRHIQLLKRFADRIVLLLDGDDAGQRRASEILELFIANQIDLRIVTLPGNMDPCDFLLQRGRDAMAELIAQAPDAWEYKIQLELRDVDLARDTHGANRALESLLATFAQAPTASLSTSGAQRLREQQILNRLAREFRLDEDQLRHRLDEHRRNRPTTRTDKTQMSSVDRAKPQLAPIERELFELLLQQPASARSVLDVIQPADLKSPTARELLQLLSDIAAQGGIPEFEQLMLATDDPGLKNLLVELDEQGRRKADVDHQVALHELLRTMSKRHAEEQLQRQQASLESDDLNEQQQMEMLLRILRDKQELIDN